MNKSTKDGIEEKRHRQERDDVDQITPTTRSATSFGCLNVAFCHSLEIIISSQNRKANLIANYGRIIRHRQLKTIVCSDDLCFQFCF